MDLNNQVVKLCVQGTQCEFAGEIEKAGQLYQQAWALAANDYEACIAAHYLAHLEKDARRKHQWNLTALEKAESAGNDEAREFYPSLYVNLGESFELLGNETEAKKYFDLAESLGIRHQP